MPEKFGSLGNMSERARLVAAAKREEDSVFGPDSIFWRMAGRDATIGLLGMLLFMFPVFLYPSSGQAWLRDRTYHLDPLGFLQRATNIIFGMVYGDRATALDAFDRFQSTHDTFNGRYTHNDQRYHGLDIEGVLWTVASLWYCLYRCNQAYAPHKLTPAETEQFFAEGVVFAEACGVPAVLMPSTRQEYRDYFRDAFDKVVITPDSSANLQRMMLYPDFSFLGFSFLRVLHPLVRLMWRPMLSGPISLMPAEMQEMVGLRTWGRAGPLFGLFWKLVARIASSDRIVDRILPHLVPVAPEGIGVAVAARTPSYYGADGSDSVCPQAVVAIKSQDIFTPRTRPAEEGTGLRARIGYARRFFAAQVRGDSAIVTDMNRLKEGQ